MRKLGKLETFVGAGILALVPALGACTQEKVYIMDIEKETIGPLGNIQYTGETEIIEK